MNRFTYLVVAGQLKMVSDVLEGAIKVGGIMYPRIIKNIMFNAWCFVPLNLPVDPIAEVLFQC